MNLICSPFLLSKMEYILLIILLAFPVCFILVGGICFTEKERLIEITIKLTIAFSFYFFFSAALILFFLTYVYAAGNAIAHLPQNSIEKLHLERNLNTICSIAIILYILLGLGLCWFAKRDLSNTLSFLIRNKDNHISLFEYKNQPLE